MFKLSSPSRRRLALWGAVAFIASTLQYGIVQIVVASQWNPTYSWSKNFISDLGNTACGQFAVHGPTTYVCSPWHASMNGSFIIGGVLTILGTLLLWKIWPSGRATTIALTLWLIAGVLKIVVGLAPENTSKSLHLLGAVNLPLQSVAILMLSFVMLRRQRTLANFGIIVGVVSFIAACLSTAAQTAGAALNLGLGNGGMERLAGYPGNLWMLVVGIVIAAQAAKPMVGGPRLPRAAAGSLTA